MTDDQSWQSPGSAPAEPTKTPFGGYGPTGPATDSAAAPSGTPLPAPIGAPLPPPGAVLPPPGAPEGWRPPPKPGLIPLRPLTLGELLGASFKTLRRNPKPVLGTAFLIVGVVSLLSILITSMPMTMVLTALETPTDEANTLLAGAMAATLLGGIASTLLLLVAYALLQGIIVSEVARGSIGEKLSFTALWARTKGRLPALFGWTFLFTLAGAVLFIGLFLVLAVVMAIVVALIGDAGWFLGILFMLLSVAGIAVLAAWLGTMVAFVPSIIVLERARIRVALRRSWRLVRGSFWRIFGIQLLVWLILSVAGQVVQTPFSLLTFIPLVIDPTGTGGGMTVIIILTVVQAGIGAIVASIAAVVQCAAVVLLYLDQRMRREGLDLVLTAYVESPEPPGDRLFDAPAGSYPSQQRPAVDSPWA